MFSLFCALPVSSGSITINDDSSVQILAEELAKAEDIDIQAVREGAQKAALAVSSAQGEEAKAAAMIEQECYEELLKGVDAK
jgi:F-type H+-transporting ATPase subunit delta